MSWVTLFFDLVGFCLFDTFMENPILFMFLLSWSFLISKTHQLQSSQTQVLLQLRKHLEYPNQLEIWKDHTIDFCSISSSNQVNVTCENNFVTELTIMGDKWQPLKKEVRSFNGFSIPNQTLSDAFLMDSFVTTLARLPTLRNLTLVSLGIWGPLPDKIHRLSSLESMDFSSNYLFGSIPPKISTMVKLQTLTLDNNFFNDTIPDWFDSLSNLSVLSLRNNQLKGSFPQSVRRIATLTNLSLSNNKISGKVSDLSSLSSLSMLDLSVNKLDSQLPIMPKGLIMASLNNNSFSGEIPKQYSQLDKVQHLDISFNSLEGTPPASLFSLPNISYLSLASNMLSGPISNHASCGAKLGFVDISNNKLTGKLPSCLSIAVDKRIIKYGGNCLSVDLKNQHSDSETYCVEEVQEKTEKSGGARDVGILIGVIGGIFFVAVILALGFIVLCRRYCHRGISEQHLLHKAAQENSATGFTSDVLTNARFISEAAKLGTEGFPMCRSFSLEEIKEATNNFDNSGYMGEGLYGKMYKGRLGNGTEVAIRCLPLSKKYSIRNLKLRLDLLAKLRHPYLVCLLGHCIDGVGGGQQDDSNARKVFLVYEHIPNGNFCAYLSEGSTEKGLEWSERLTILIGVAKAVHFLHTGVISSFLNNRLKTNNILLTEHRIAKLSDYGLSIISEEHNKLETKGEGHKSWEMTNLEDDVYSFGFIILESLVGHLVVARREEFLSNEVTSLGSNDGRRQIVDPVVLATCSQESLSVVISIMNKCLSSDSSTRPSFEDILWNLQYAAQVQSTATPTTTASGEQRF